MKAQSFFGGTNPKETGGTVRQVGHTGKVQSKTGSMSNMHENIKMAKSSPVPSNIKWVNSKQPPDVGRAR